MMKARGSLITQSLANQNNSRFRNRECEFGLRYKAYLRVFVLRKAQRFSWLPPQVTLLHAAVNANETCANEQTSTLLTSQILSQCEPTLNKASFEAIPLILYSDAAWAYHENMMAEKPLLYICGSSCPTCGIHPEFATVDALEAGSHEQGEDNVVITAPLNGEIWSLADAFSIRWHRPQITKKRKRKNWTNDHHKQGNYEPRSK